MLRGYWFISHITILIILIFAGCKKESPTSPQPEEPGKLSIAFSLKPARDAGANVTRVSVLISKDTFADSLDLSISGDSASGTFTDLLVRTYTISVNIYDGTTLIGTGSGQATVTNSQTSTVRITVTLFSGSLEVIVGWNFPLVNGLVAYYPFNGNAKDERGNGNNGTVYGATLTTDRFGASNRSYYFNGTDNHISVANSPSLDSLSNVTISAWINLDSNVFVQSKTILAMSDSFTTTDFSLIINGDAGYGRNRPHAWLPSGWTYFNGSTILSPNVWYHVVMTYNSISFKSYVNGINDGVLSVSGSIRTSGFPLLIGRATHALPYYSFAGKIDDIRIYNRALSDSEILALYHEGGW